MIMEPCMLSFLFRFEFEESYKVNSIALYSDSYKHAMEQVALFLGESCFTHLCSIHRFF